MLLRSLRSVDDNKRRVFRRLSLLVALWTAVLAAAAIAKIPVNPDAAPPADDGKFYHLTGCSLSNPVIAPPRTDMVIHYTLIGAETVFVGVFIDSAGLQIGEISASRRQLPRQGYQVPFEGILRGEIADRVLGDGLFDIRVRVRSDTGRVEQCALPMEIDRKPPRLLRYDVNGDTARVVTVRNGDTILIDAYMDRPSYAIVADFTRIDNDTASLFTSILDQGDGRYTVRRFISDANTTPDAANLPVTLTYTDLAGNVLKDSSLKVCLSNHPPRLVSARVVNEGGAVVRNGGRVSIETIWESSDTLLALSADFSSLDAGWSPANVMVSRFSGNRYEIHYTVSSTNTREDGSGYLATFRATDHGCGVSDLETVTLELDNMAGSRPLLDPLPLSTRSSPVTVEGSAPGSYQVEIKRNGTAVDTALTDATGRFAGLATLDSGANTITAEGFDSAGNKTAASLPGTIVYLTEAFVTVPKRFSAGSRIEVGLSRRGESARVDLWNLSGDLIAVLEDRTPRDYYQLAWDGRNSSGETVAAGPVLSTIEIVYPDGSRETMREAFVLVKR